MTITVTMIIIVISKNLTLEVPWDFAWARRPFWMTSSDLWWWYGDIESVITRKTSKENVPIFSASTAPADHDDVIKWKHYLRYWRFVRGIHRLSVGSPHKGQWRGALIFALICAWRNDWADDRDAGDLRRNDTHYYVTVMGVPAPQGPSTKVGSHINTGLALEGSIAIWFHFKRMYIGTCIAIQIVNCVSWEQTI